MENEKKPCRKCLLQEFDSEEYRAKILKEVEWMDEEMRAPEEEYQRRLTLCKACEKLLQGTCLSCGCYVELRAAARGGHCPKKKW